MLFIWKADKAHLRANFFKARKVSQLPGIRTLVNTAIVDYIRKVYDVESEIDALHATYVQRGETMPSSVVLSLRQTKSAPMVKKFKDWVDTLLPGTPPTALWERRLLIAFDSGRN
jgi:hypothetical protein